MSPRLRWLALVVATSVALAALAGVLFALLRPQLETAIRQRLVREAQDRGLSLTLGGLRVQPSLRLELEQLQLDDPGQLRLQAASATLRPRLTWRGLLGRAARVDLGRTRIELPAGLRVELHPSSWLVEDAGRELRVVRRAAGERLALAVARANDTTSVSVAAENASLSQLLRVLYHGCPVADFGTVSGTARLGRTTAGDVEMQVHAHADGFALAAWAASGEPRCADGDMGEPTAAALELQARWRPDAGSFEASRWRVVARGVEARGRLALTDVRSQPVVDLELEVPRLAFAPLLATAALDQAAEDLGSAALSLQVKGPLFDPAALVVSQSLDFTPPARPLPAIERLRGPFVHRFDPPSGPPRSLQVSPESPDFIGLDQVPPLLLRTLLIAEDAGFWGHAGVDLQELPVAFATNLVRGRLARGGSTIPQQLAKNLFLSGTKTLGRKLEEASLALLLDATLGKRRELEIYLNVIEWGPGLYGLRPASRHYFGLEPEQLGPKQMVFLVSLIPGPLKYQRSFPDGVPTPFFEGLMTTLLTKLLSVGAITPEEYDAALAAPLGLLASATS